MRDSLTKKVTFYCSLAYFFSYITRLGYAAGLLEMTAALGVEKSFLSLGCTGLFITYGAGQFLSGWLGDRVSPRHLISSGLAGASICNLLLVLCHSPAAMVCIWCVNGLFQAMLWPPMVRLMAEVLGSDGYRAASKGVSVASNIATICVYALMSLFSKVRLWEGYFVMASVLGIAVAGIFLWGTKSFPTREMAPTSARADAPKKQPIGAIALACGLPTIMLAIIMQGMLRDGVSTWMPSLIADTAGLGNAASILSAAVLPIFSVLCINIASWMQKKSGNDVKLSLLLFCVCAACSGIMLPLMNSALACIACMAVITGCAHAINFLLICHVPSYFARFECVSSVSGLINSCTYIGSALSTYGIALISQSCGWFTTVAIWAAISLLGAGMCLLSKRPWTRFISGNN